MNCFPSGLKTYSSTDVLGVKFHKNHHSHSIAYVTLYAYIYIHILVNVCSGCQPVTHEMCKSHRVPGHVHLFPRIYKSYPWNTISIETSYLKIPNTTSLKIIAYVQYTKDAPWRILCACPNMVCAWTYVACVLQTHRDSQRTCSALRPAPIRGIIAGLPGPRARGNRLSFPLWAPGSLEINVKKIITSLWEKACN